MKRFRKSKAFTLVEIMIVVLIIGILLAIAIPNFLKARESSRRQTCIANLKQIDGAKEQWAMENKQPSTATPTWGDLMGAAGTAGYLKGNQPTCPSSGVYTIGDMQTAPTCSLSAAPTSHVLP